MLRFHFLIISVLSLITAPASAGLFSDDEAREQIKQAETRLIESQSKLEARLAAAEALLAKMEAANKQQTSAMLDLQMSIETQGAELRKLRGQNEELTHELQDSEKRQKDYYVDLDGRLRRFEAVDTAVADKASGTKAKTDDPVAENRALEAAYGFYKAERYQNALVAFQEFLNSYPQSTHTANIRYWMGNTYFLLKDYKSSLENYQIIVEKFDTYPKISDVLFNIADCQELLKDVRAAKRTLKQIAAKYPNSNLAVKAKKRLAEIK